MDKHMAPRFVGLIRYFRPAAPQLKAAWELGAFLPSELLFLPAPLVPIVPTQYPPALLLLSTYLRGIAVHFCPQWHLSPMAILPPGNASPL